MAIAPLPGSSGISAVGVSPAESGRPARHDHGSGTAHEAEPAVPTEGPQAAGLRRLKTLASQTGLQVRFETLPQSNVTVVRLIDSQSGHVVGEFPPEGVAQALADLEARAAARTGRPVLDHRA